MNTLIVISIMYAATWFIILTMPPGVSYNHTGFILIFFDFLIISRMLLSFNEKLFTDINSSICLWTNINPVYLINAV